MTKCTNCMRGDCCGGDFDELKTELDAFRDASRLLTGKLEDALAELAELREAISLHKKCILRSIGESITPTQEDLDLWAALQEKGE